MTTKTAVELADEALGAHKDNHWADLSAWSHCNLDKLARAAELEKEL